MKLLDEARIIKPGRALFAVIGIGRIFGAKPLTVHKQDLDASVKIEPAIHDAIEAFLDGKREADPLPPFDFAATKDLLTRVVPANQAAKNLDQFRGHPGGDEFANIADTARAYLFEKIPRRLQPQKPTFGIPPRDPVPARSELLIFRSFVSAAENPVWAIRQLLAATLSRDHIEALQRVWPDALNVAMTAAQNGIADRLEKDAGYRLPRRIARQLSVLLAVPDVPGPLVAFLQQTFAIPEASPEKPTPPDSRPDDSLKTPLQKISESW